MNDNHEHPSLDGLLDEALKEYGNVEPRSGLEHRVLANLRIEQEHLTSRNQWWGWAVGCAVVTIAAVVAVLVTTPRTPANLGEANAKSQSVVAPPQVPSLRRQLTHGPRAQQPRLMDLREKPSNPRLETFPSPQPLSEQEVMLQRYVNEHRDHAVLVARAQTELSKRDRREFSKRNASGTESESREEPQ
jgi:hypothetical protein